MIKPGISLYQSQNVVLFFKRGEVYHYDFIKGEVVGSPKSVMSAFVGVPAHPSAVVQGQGDRQDKLYFFFGQQYYRFDLKQARVDQGYPASTRDHWRGMTFTQIDAAFTSNNRKMYFFSGDEYIRYDFINGADPGYPKKIRTHWPGIPDNIDAVILGFGDRSNKAYFFKGAEYYRFDLSNSRVDPGYPQAIRPMWPGLLTHLDIPRQTKVPFVLRIGAMGLDRTWGLERPSVNLDWSGAGRTYLPFIKGVVRGVCQDSKDRILLLIDAGSPLLFQIVRLLPSGQRDFAFGVEGIADVTVAPIDSRAPLRRAFPVAIDCGLNDEPVVGVNVEHEIRRGTAHGVFSHLHIRINTAGQIFRPFWPTTIDGNETLTDIKVTPLNRVFVAGLRNKGLTGPVDEFITCYEDSAQYDLGDWPVNAGFIGNDTLIDITAQSGRKVVLGKDVLGRVYVALVWSDKKQIHLWRLTDKGQRDTFFPHLELAMPDNALTQHGAIRFEFSQIHGAIYYQTGNGYEQCLCFDYEGRDMSIRPQIAELSFGFPPAWVYLGSNLGVNRVDSRQSSAFQNFIGEQESHRFNLAATSRKVDQLIVAGDADIRTGGVSGLTARPDFLPSLHGFRFVNRMFPGVFMSLLEFNAQSELLKVGASGEWSLCGGMAQAAADYYHHGMPVPDFVAAPPTGGVMLNYIIERQKASFIAGAKGAPTTLDLLNIQLSSFLSLADNDPFSAAYTQVRPIAPTVANFIAMWSWEKGRNRTASWREQASFREWPAIKAMVDHYGFAQLGLCYATRARGGKIHDNHQVLVTGYETVGGTGNELASLTIYDANHPGLDSLVIRARRKEETWIDTGSRRSTKIYGYELTQSTLAGDAPRPVYGMFLIPMLPAKPPADWHL